MAEPFTEDQKRQILALAPRSGVDVVHKILYGGSITRNGNTIHFDGKNSHALKLHLNAPGFHPRRGPVTLEEIEKYLPLALAQEPKIETKKNKKGKRSSNKIYKFTDGKITYTLVTASRGGFRSFYSNKKAANAVTDLDRSSATGMLHDNNIPQNPENASDTDNNLRFSVAPDIDTPAFKDWFRNSKVVDQDGKPLVVYHGTNWDILSEAPGEAVFDDKYRGAGSGDNGFYGRGFYFTFGNGEASKGEAGYYGKNVYQFYLSIQNPFYFTETLLNWNGKRVLGDEVSSVEIINAVKQIPEKLENPLMVITSKTHPDTSVVVILELTDKNGDAVVVPILLDGISQRGKIDAHIMTSAQGRSNAFTELVKNAIDKENNGTPSILYAQKNAESAANAEGVQFPNGFAFDSVNHNITDVGLKVKPQTETLQFKNWFKNSKVVDQDGKPLVVYHGTNWDILSEAPGEAVFDDKYRGAGSGDNGFYGRGFYFTFGNGEASKGEAGYYGKNVYQFYLSIQNPFYFTETLLNWNGKRVLGDEVSSVEIINAVKLFPELLKDLSLDTYDQNGGFAGEITLDKYARIFEKTYKEKKFLVRKTSDPNEIVVECDPIKREEDGV